MRSKLTTLQVSIYKLLKEGGKQSELHDAVEYVITAVICLNVVLILAESLDVPSAIRPALDVARNVFFIFFSVEYILRVFIADIVMRDKKHPILSRLKYMVTPAAIINLLALLPVLLGGAFIDFRIFRVLRLLRITQLTSLRRYTDTLSKVFKLKGAQLLSSLFIVFVFVLVSAVVVYDFEHAAQPEVFNNIPSCMWWAVSSITTVGYGDMFPVTSSGKVLGSLMSIFGVFLMAIPVGILTTGFMEVTRANNASKQQ